jgi:hypothetical protein
MGFKEKMMENMIGNITGEDKIRMMKAMMGKFFDTMTKEDKQAMMHGMMDSFFGKMSAEEKKEMMSAMMPKMMAGMMGGGGSSMMDMMKKMMGRMTGGKETGDDTESGTAGFNPMDMCHKMMMGMGRSSELASYATPEVRALFEEWSEQIENEIFTYIKETNTTDPDRLAEHFKLSKNSINFFLSKLAQKDKIKLKAEKA